MSYKKVALIKQDSSSLEELSEMRLFADTIGKIAGQAADVLDDFGYVY